MAAEQQHRAQARCAAPGHGGAAAGVGSQPGWAAATGSAQLSSSTARAADSANGAWRSGRSSPSSGSVVFSSSSVTRSQPIASATATSARPSLVETKASA